MGHTLLWILIPYAVMEIGYTVMASLLPIREHIDHLSVRAITEQDLLTSYRSVLVSAHIDTLRGKLLYLFLRPSVTLARESSFVGSAPWGTFLGLWTPFMG